MSTTPQSSGYSTTCLKGNIVKFVPVYFTHFISWISIWMESLRILTFLTICLLGASSTGCVKQIDIEEVAISEDLVMSSVIRADEIIRVYVSETLPVNAPAPGELSVIPSVRIYEENVLVDTCEYHGSGLFVSDITATIGRCYTIEVANGTHVMSGKDTVPDFATVTSIKQDIIRSGNEFGDDYLNYKITLESTSNNVEYFEFERFAIGCEGSLCGSDRLLLGPNQDPIITAEGIMEFDPTSVIFSSRAFVNGRYEVNFQLLLASMGRAIFKNPFELKDGRYLRIAKLSSEAFRFRRSLMQYNHNLTTGERLEEFKGLIFGSEPTSIYSNIENGQGIVIALAEEYYEVEY